MTRTLALILALGAAPAWADDGRQAFIDANVITTFYHEFGHALVDILALPVFGGEEDAVDALATLLVHRLHDEDEAAALIADTALGYDYARAESEGADEGDGLAYWSVHSPDGQRQAMMLCHFYGADPAARFDLAVELGMPEDMAETCEGEFAQIEAAWGPVLEGLAGGKGAGLVLLPSRADPHLVAVVAEEVARINARFALPVAIEVEIAPCGEANAFYSLDDRRITMCTEFPDWFGAAWDADG